MGMLLHRHLEDAARERNVTKLRDVAPKREEFVSEVFPPSEEEREQPKRGRKKKEE